MHATAGGDAAATLVGEGVGREVDEADEDGRVERVPIEESEDAGVESARCLLGLANESHSGVFRCAGDGARGQQSGDHVAHMAAPIRGQTPHDLGADLQDGPGRRLESVDVSEAPHMYSVGHHREVVTDQVDDRVVFGRLLGVG